MMRRALPASAARRSSVSPLTSGTNPIRSDELPAATQIIVTAPARQNVHTHSTASTAGDIGTRNAPSSASAATINTASGLDQAGRRGSNMLFMGPFIIRFHPIRPPQYNQTPAASKT